jgi:hypothetical protein
MEARYRDGGYDDFHFGGLSRTNGGKKDSLVAAIITPLLLAGAVRGN